MTTEQQQRTPAKARVVGGCSWAIIVAALVPVGLVLSCVAFVLFSSIGLPVEWEVPDGYQGWAALTVENPACTPLTRRGLTIIITVDQYGRACTSDPPLTRYRRYSVYYVAADGRRTRLPWHDPTYPGVQASRGGIASSSSSPFQIDIIFIGTWGAAEQALLSDLFP